MNSSSSRTPNLWSIGLCTIGFLSTPVDALAYEQATHGAMTREAILQSQLSPSIPDLLQRLGIASSQLSLGSQYLDLADNGLVATRSNAPSGPQYPPAFGRAKVQDANRQSVFQPELGSLPGWLMLGAIREDDTPYDAGALENNPQDDPNGAISRVLNHFHDPYNDRGLQISIEAPRTRASDWALTDAGNHFNALRAREAMWRALTLKTSPAQGVADLPFMPSSDMPTKEALRMAYWATTFRALGDIVHLLQDMAQPQHTRNDPHSGLFCGGTGSCTGGHASFYERYVDSSVVGNTSFTLRERTTWEYLDHTSGGIQDKPVPTVPGTLAYGGYPVPRFADYRSYFVTATGSASVAGKGLANYSNQGFYSAGTNISDPRTIGSGYPEPSPTGIGLGETTLPDGTVTNTGGKEVGGSLRLKLGSVVDTLNPNYTEGAIRLASYGLFDQFLKPIGKSQYTLNHYNYDDQMRLLIPRAVAYTAGLLDFFFRGRMEIGLADEGVYGIVDHAQLISQGPTDPLGGFKGFKQIRLRLSNSTPTIVTTSDGTRVPQTMTGGVLVAVLKFHRNACYSDRLDGEITDPQQLSLCRTPDEEIVVSDPVKVPEQGAIPMADANPGSAEFSFRFANALPINAWDVVLQVVYRGQLGGESDAVVVATRDISEPTFITAFNDTDKILIGGSCYDPVTVAATDALWNQLGAACKPTSGSSRYVTSICANVPLNVRLTTGTGTAPVTVSMESSGPLDQRILPRRFGRIAILGELAGGTTMTLGFYNGSLVLQGAGTQHYLNYRAEQQNLVTFTANTYVSTLSTVTDSYVRHRGVKAWQGQYFAVDGTSGAVSGACPDAQLDPLLGAERSPQAATITGWVDP